MIRVSTWLISHLFSVSFGFATVPKERVAVYKDYDAAFKFLIEALPSHGGCVAGNINYKHREILHKWDGIMVILTGKLSING